MASEEGFEVSFSVVATSSPSPVGEIVSSSVHPAGEDFGGRDGAEFQAASFRGGRNRFDSSSSGMRHRFHGTQALRRPRSFSFPQHPAAGGPALPKRKASRSRRSGRRIHPPSIRRCSPTHEPRRYLGQAHSQPRASLVVIHPQDFNPLARTVGKGLAFDPPPAGEKLIVEIASIARKADHADELVQHVRRARNGPRRSFRGCSRISRRAPPGSCARSADMAGPRNAAIAVHRAPA